MCHVVIASVESGHLLTACYEVPINQQERTVKITYMAITSESDALKVVESDGYALRYVKDQTEAVCLKAVERNGDALQYVLIYELFKSIAAHFGIQI